MQDCMQYFLAGCFRVGRQGKWEQADGPNEKVMN